MSRRYPNRAILSLFIVGMIGICGLSLTAINIYGLSQDIRPAVFFDDELRFRNDKPISFEESLEQINRRPQESDRDYSARLTSLISNSLAHIHWERYENTRFNQLVPIWENYFIYFMGKFSGIPEYEKYHFADSKRSLKRGIGICGDASMVMSGMLRLNNIDHQIVSFPGHVVTTVYHDNGDALTYDPDFGVLLPFDIKEINENPKLIEAYYQEHGYSAHEVRVLKDVYSRQFELWDGVNHFIAKKYYFEKISYWLKWPLPLALILASIYLWNRSKTKKIA